MTTDRDAKYKLAIEMADAMIKEDLRLLDLVTRYSMPLIMVYKTLMRTLKKADRAKYLECREVMVRHKYERIPRGDRY